MHFFFFFFFAGSPFHPRIVDHSRLVLLTDLRALKDEQGRLALEPGEEKRLEFSTKEAGPGRDYAVFVLNTGKSVRD